MALTKINAEQVLFTQTGTGASERDADAIFKDSTHAKDFGVVADGSTDDAAALNAFADHLDTLGGGDFALPSGDIKITAPIVFTEPPLIHGNGTGATDIINTTNNSVAIKVDGSGGRVDRTRMQDFHIQHEATGNTAIEMDDAAYSIIENIRVDCATLGNSGLLLGDDNATPLSAAFLTTVNNFRCTNHTNFGIKINSTGTQWVLDQCFVNSSVNGAHGLIINKEGVTVRSGEYGANNTGGIPIYLLNRGSGDIGGVAIQDLMHENIPSGEYGIVVDGTTNAWVGVVIENNRANFNVSVVGTLVKFENAKYCKLLYPQIDNPTSGGTLLEWGQDADDCLLVCDYEVATAPITVHASALRATKVVKGVVRRSNVTNITTNSNLTTILEDGVDDLPPGFVPVHNGTAWNYQIATLSDDTATSFTPPSVMGTLRLINDDDATTFGVVAYDADATTAVCESLGSGSDFNVTTGILAGTTGTNGKVTVSTHTDGKVYVEARKGTSSITVLFESAIFGV